jgi:hypothetical protein
MFGVYLVISLLILHFTDKKYKSLGVDVRFLSLVAMAFTFPFQIVLVVYQLLLRLGKVHLEVMAMIEVESNENTGDK